MSTVLSRPLRAMIDITDQLFSLRDENLQLKKRLTGNDDRTKQLLVKIQHLSKQLSEPSAKKLSKEDRAKRHSKEDRETDTLLDELRNQVQTVNQQNSSLRNKVHYFKTLHEAESRKRSSYGHIPPRINSVSILEAGNELVIHLREKIVDLETSLSQLKSENNILHNAKLHHDNQHDIDMVSLQHENNRLKKQLLDHRKALDELEDSNRATTKMHKEMLEATETLSADLEKERKASNSLFNDLQEERLKTETHLELQVMFEDAQKEKKLLEEELARLVDTKFSTNREEEYQLQLSTLKNRIAELQNSNSEILSEKLRLVKDIEEKTELLEKVTVEKQNSDILRYELQNQLDEMLKKASAYGKLTSLDLEEAMELLYLKRNSGLTLEYLKSMPDLNEERKKMLLLRQQYVECAQELEKTLQLLYMQEEINGKCKLEIVQLNKKMDLLQNEYELRLEEYSRLVDIRGTKIETLERQLRNIAAGKYSTTENTEPMDIANEIELLPGQNLLTFSIHGAKFSQDGIHNLQATSLIDLEFDKWKTFIVVDFYDFATQVTPLGIGRNPIYNHDMKYIITVDDFFFHYLQQTSVSFGVYYSNGLEFAQIGFSIVKFGDIMGKNFQSSIYVMDVLGLDMKPLGKLEYKLSLQISMPLATRAYHERATALNLLSGSEPDKIKAFDRSPVNNLNLKIRNFKFDNVPGTISDLAPFGLLHLDPIWRDISIPPVSYGSGTFGFEYILPMQMDQELDRYLRTTKMTLSFADDTKDWLYGSTKIDLSPLAVNQRIAGTFDVTDSKGNKCGHVTVEFFWDQVYHTGRPNLVSIMDDESIKAEMIITAPIQVPKVSKLYEAAGPVLLTEPVVNLPESSQISASEPLDDTVLISTLSLNSLNFDVTEPNNVSLVGKSFSIIISGAHIYMDNAQVSSLLQNTRQVFIAYEFLDFDQSELETPSLLVPESGAFTFESLTEGERPQMLERMLSKDNFIVFSLVDEPPESENTSVSCVDIGVCTVPLLSLLDHGPKTEHKIWSLNKQVCLGTLSLEIQGIEEMKLFIDTHLLST